MIITQLGLPQHTHVTREITNMKDAVDSQELKIQKSLVNEEDVLGDILNRGIARTEKNQSREHKLRKHQTYADESDMDDNYWHHASE